MEKLLAKASGFLSTEDWSEIDMARRNAYNITTNAHSNEAEEIRLKIKAFEKMIERKMIRDGWNGYLVSFMFNPVPWATRTKLDIMGEALYRFYATFRTRVVRNPNSIFQLSQRPLLIAAPDYPVPKHQKQKISDVTIFTCMASSWSRRILA